MNCPAESLRTKRLIRLLALVLALAAVVPQSRASTNVWSLADNNSTASIDVADPRGMFNWSLTMPDNSVQNQLFQQWFWYRAGSTLPNRSIDTIGIPTVSQPNARTLSASYANSSYSVRVDYILTGGSISSGVSDIGESITISNASLSTLDFHFYQYSTFQLEGTSTGEAVQLSRNLRNLWNEADVLKGTLGLTETVTTPGAQHAEGGTAAQVLNDVQNLANLTDLVAAGANTNAWALEWDFQIAPGSTALISKDKYLTVPAIPEPAVLGLISVGVVLYGLRRRVRR